MFFFIFLQWPLGNCIRTRMSRMPVKSGIRQGKRSQETKKPSAAKPNNVRSNVTPRHTLTPR